MKNKSSERTLESWDKPLLVALLLIVMIPLLGFATFGRNPHWIAHLPSSLIKPVGQFFSISFRIFGEGQTLGLTLLLVLYLHRKVGKAWVFTFLGTFLFTLLLEFTGTSYGFPFGQYSYSNQLGWKLFGKVPYTVPASWFMVSLPCFAIALRCFPTPSSRWKRMLVGTGLLVLWDLSLDPAMTTATNYWTWTGTSFYYAMPIQNLLAWVLVGFLLMLFYEYTSVETWLNKCNSEWLYFYYAGNLLVTFGMVLVSGLWLAIIINILVIVSALIVLVPRWKRGRTASLLPHQSMLPQVHGGISK